ncbi:MAG: tRNA (adenosine(37)-N6)-threonylcarbamoyltransferase complex dimerization subunit type 1 TsaB [Lachnospiraceae bacterium]|nr:tRNA (adenosine(37)-N6)-threonylcarbamoyltransferase complex dimerization subunit type 1 TsaB [Lachnospiraceae bacterium]
MKILALDSSGLVATVAILEDETVLAEYTLNYKMTHSQTLLPMLDEIVKRTGFVMEDLDAIAVAAGPGSFTGLRIGCATAKGLGLALDKPIIPIPTVDGLAYNLAGTSSLVCPLMDARRNQVYTGLYAFQGEQMEVCIPQKAVAIEEIIADVNASGREVIFLGDGVPVQKDILQREVKVPFRFAPPHLSRQRAAALGTLAIQYYKAGNMQHARDHKPDYLRLSQAERERLEKEKHNEGEENGNS